MKKIAVLTSVRNDQMFKEKWIAYYSKNFGAENLYMVIDGEDQPVPSKSTGINTIVVPFVPKDVVAGEKSRAARASDLAGDLFSQGYEIVIATDIDEFLVLDPKIELSLAQYLSERKIKGTLSPIGLDVVEHVDFEKGIDLSKKFLEQRRYAFISDRYTKASIINEPLRWGSGQHRVRRRNFEIDPNLLLFHFGNADRAVSMARMNDADRQKMNWGKHMQKRERLYDDVKNAQALEGDERFASALQEMKWKRRFYAWNKPGIVKKNAVIRIPERFQDVV